MLLLYIRFYFLFALPHKSLAFLYNNDEKSEREIMETLPFTMATKRIKYLGINLPKEEKTCTQKTIKN